MDNFLIDTIIVTMYNLTKGGKMFSTREKIDKDLKDFIWNFSDEEWKYARETLLNEKELWRKDNKEDWEDLIDYVRLRKPLSKEKCFRCKRPFETKTNLYHRFITDDGNVCYRCYEPYYNGYHRRAKS